MTTHSILSTVLAKDVVIDDIKTLNAEIVGQMTAFHEDWNYVEGGEIPTVLTITEEGLSFWGYGAVEPVDMPDSCSRWNAPESRIVARHLTSGTLVLRFSPDREGDHFHVITPHNVKEIDEGGLIALFVK